VQQSDLYVLSWSCISHSFFLTVIDVHNLTRLVAGTQQQLVTHSHSALFNFTEDDYTSILHFIEDGNSQGSFGISLGQLNIIENLDESLAIVPVASSLRCRFLDVVATDA
jgi:hypothetical protein